MKELIILINLLLCSHSLANSGKNSLISEFLSIPLPEKFKVEAYQFGEKYRLQTPYEFIPEPNLGYIHRPDTQVRHIERTENEIIYDVQYNFDQLSRRKIPLQMKDRKKFIMLYGCSFTYGNGLNDNQTLGYYLAKNSDDHVYNYAIGGSGPHMLLELLRTRAINKEILQNDGKLVYVFNSFHVARTLGTATNLNWLHSTPFYIEDKNQFLKAGTLASSRPWRTKILQTLSKLGLPTLIGRDFPWTSRNDLKYFARLIKEIEIEFQKHFPKGEFIVYLHPLSNIDPKLRVFFKEREISFIEGLKLDRKDSRYRVSPNDLHPSHETNKKISRDLLKLLN